MVPRPGSPRSRLVPFLWLISAALAPLALAAAPGSTAPAAPPAKPANPRFEPWTVEDLLGGETVRQLALSPDGKLAVWSVQSLDKVGKEEKRLTQLWARSLESRNSRPVQLTRGESSVDAFQISPDGKNLAFLTDRKIPGADEAEGSQIWLLPLATPGEARPVSRFDRGVDSFVFIDAETLLVARQESKSALEAEREKGGDTATAVSDPTGAPPVRLFKLGLDGKATRLSKNGQWISGMAVAPDGKKAVVLVAQDLDYEFNSKVAPKTYLVDLATAEWKEILGGGRVVPLGVRFSPDSQSVYLLDAETSHPLYDTAVVYVLYRYGLRGDKLEKIELDWPRGLAELQSPFWPLGRSPGARADDLLLILADGVKFRSVRLEGGPQGLAMATLEGGHAGKIDRFAVSRDGRAVLYQASTLAEPPQLYAARLDGHRLADEWQVSELNAGYKNKNKGRYEVVRFKGARGDEVEGLLLYPFDYQQGRKYPLVLDIHGGPASADFDTWDSSLDRIWQEKGAFVLQVNYHGSSSYGLEWVESIREKYYELEIPDIEAGVDALIARGLVDPDRMASTGWSNGGILTAELITRTGRYKAAVVGAADVEWLSDWGNVDFGASFDNYYFGGPPWEKTQYYIEKSPFFRLDQVTTPTLIHTGTADRNVPPHQSWSLFRALQDLGKAPVRFLTYPGEPHGLQKIAHRRQRYREDVAWLEKYLFKDGRESDPAIPPGSLLAGRLARAAAARDGAGRWGVEQDGLLLPELVAFGGLEVGRFEVTRAQFAAFAKATGAAFELIPGEDNLPATGIGFAAAQAYAAWASRKLEGARLPTREEAEQLAEKAGEGGNTLERWLGYGANPDDAAKVRAAAETGGATLLEPVGQGPAARFGVAGPAVFDLDGNAAEWAVLPQEKGARETAQGFAAGPSADRANDATDGDPPAAAYTGFRLVRQAP